MKRVQGRAYIGLLCAASILLTAVMLSAVCLSAAHRKDTLYTEAVWRIRDHDPAVYYVRFCENVTAAADTLRVTYTAKKRDVPLVPDGRHISLYTGERTELVLTFPQPVSDFTVSGIRLSDGTPISQTVYADSVSELSCAELEGTYLFKRHDALYLPHFLQRDDGCDVAVGSVWAFRFHALTYPRDPYLRARMTLKGDGIELCRNGEEYVFASVGQGSVSICVFDVPCHNTNVRVLETTALKAKILRTMPFRNAIWLSCAQRLLNPYTALLPMLFVYILLLIAYIRMLFV